MPPVPTPLAYFLTWRTYGTWLPGDERGFVDETRNAFGEPFKAPDFRLAEAARGIMRSEPIEFDDDARAVVDACIREACAFRDWTVVALNVRTNHVHLVVAAEETAAKVLNTLKARCSRELHERGLVGASVWARGGSKRVVWDEPGLEAVVEYVLHRQ